MTFSKQQAEIAGEIFGLPDEAVAWLQIVPYKGSLETAVPTDPLIYRWYEIVSVYGTTIKELIHEEFGDGIMSAIDFFRWISSVRPIRKATRVKVLLSGKFPAVQNVLTVPFSGLHRDKTAARRYFENRSPRMARPKRLTIDKSGTRFATSGLPRPSSRRPSVT